MPDGFVSPLIHTLDEHAHSISKVYPTLSAGVTISTGAGAYQLSAAYAEIVPVNTITSPFDIHWITIESASADEIYEIVLYAGTTEIGRIRAVTTITVGGHAVLPPVKFQCEIQPANTQIQAKAASAGGGDSVTISIHYHTY